MATVPTWMLGHEITIWKTQSGGYAVLPPGNTDVTQAAVFETRAACDYHINTNFVAAPY